MTTSESPYSRRSPMMNSPRTFSAKVGDSISEMRICSAFARSFSAAQTSSAARTAAFEASSPMSAAIAGTRAGT